MKIILGERQSGKTANLIKMAAQDKKNGVYSLIVCLNQFMVHYTYDLALKMGLEIAHPISFGHFIDGKGRYPETKYYIDDLGMILASLANQAGTEARNILGFGMTVNQTDEYAKMTGTEKDELIVLGNVQVGTGL